LHQVQYSTVVAKRLMMTASLLAHEHLIELYELLLQHYYAEEEGDPVDAVVVADVDVDDVVAL